MRVRARPAPITGRQQASSPPTFPAASLCRVARAESALRTGTDAKSKQVCGHRSSRAGVKTLAPACKTTAPRDAQTARHAPSLAVSSAGGFGWENLRARLGKRPGSIEANLQARLGTPPGHEPGGNTQSYTAVAPSAQPIGTEGKRRAMGAKPLDRLQNRQAHITLFSRIDQGLPINSEAC